MGLLNIGVVCWRGADVENFIVKLMNFEKAKCGGIAETLTIKSLLGILYMHREK